MFFHDLMLSGEQIRAGRALARIDQAELAKRSGMSLETIKRLERIRGPVDANIKTLTAITRAFQNLGIAFETTSAGGVGVRKLPLDEGQLLSPIPAIANTTGLRRLIFHGRVGEAVQSNMEVIAGAVGRPARLASVVGVTGALLARDGRLLCALEGSPEAVQQVYEMFGSDPRHAELSILDSRPVTARQFAEFSLCCGVTASEHGAFDREPAFAEGFRPQLLTPMGALGLLAIARDLETVPPRVSRPTEGDCPLQEICLDRCCSKSAVVIRSGRALTGGGDRA